MKLFKKLYNKKSETHKKCIDIQLMIFKTFMNGYNWTKPNCKFFADLSDEDKSQYHEMLGDYMLESLITIYKEDEEDLVRVINRIYKEELDEARKSYKSRTRHWTDNPPEHNEEFMEKIHKAILA